MRSVPCNEHADFRILDTIMNQRRYTYNKDLLWLLHFLSQHGRILKLKLGFCGRRNVRMSSRDRDFLTALQGVKTDKLDVGNPRRDESGSIYDVCFSRFLFPLSIQSAIILGSLGQSKLTPECLTEGTPWQTRSTSRGIAPRCDGPSPTAERT